MSVGEWNVRASVDISSVRQASKTLQNELKSAGDSIEDNIWNKGKRSISWFSSSLRSLGPLLASVFAVQKVYQFVKWVFTLWAQVEDAKNSFTTLLGSEQAALKELQDIDTFAAKTPFSKLGLTSINQQLIWFGYNAKEGLAISKVLGDSISAVGKWEEDLKGVVLAMGQIKAKGKLSAEEIMQMAERGIPAMAILKDKLHLTAKQMDDLWNSGISAETGINALLIGLNEKFAWEMDKKWKNLSGLWSNFMDNVQSSMAGMVTGVSDGAKNILGTINSFFDNNKVQVMEFGSDVLTFMYNIFSSFWVIVKSVWEWTTWVLQSMSWEVGNTGNSWKKFFLFIALWFQTVFLIANTIWRVIWWSVNSIWTAIWGFIYWAINAVKLLIKTDINLMIWAVNTLIKWLNAASNALWIWDLFKQLDYFSTSMEVAGIKAAIFSDKVDKAFWWEGIASSNKSIIDWMVANISAYEVDTVKAGKKTSGVMDMDDVNQTLEDMKNKLNQTGNAWSNSWKKTKAAADEAKKALKKELEDGVNELKKWVEWLDDKWKKLWESQVKLREEEKKYEEETIDWLRKIRSEIKANNDEHDKTIKKLQEERAEKEKDLQKSTDQKIAERSLSIDEERKKLQEDLVQLQKDNPNATSGRADQYSIATLKSVWAWDLWGVTGDELLKIKDIQEKLKKLDIEKVDNQKYINQGVYDEVKNYENSTETQKILLDKAKEKKQIQDDSNKSLEDEAKKTKEQNDKLDRQAQIYNNLRNKNLSEWDIKALQWNKDFNNLSQDEQDLILSLARKRIELTNYKVDVIKNETEIKDAVVALSNESTTLQQANLSLLTAEYQKIIAKLDIALAKQQQLLWQAWIVAPSNNSSSSTKKWYSSGGFTWSDGWNVHPNEWVAPAWMLKEMGPVFQNLEKIRSSGNTTSQSITKNQTNNVTVNGGMDLKQFLDYAKWKL